MIKNVVFDIGNVLIRFDIDGELLKAFGSDAEAKRMKPIIFSKYWHNCDLGVITLEEQIRCTCESSPKDSESIIKMLSNRVDMFHPLKDSENVVKELKNAGFSEAKPWFYVNENYKDINVRQQENDENSVLNFYRKAIKLRKELSCVRHGNYTEYNKSSSKLYVYTREDEKQKLLVICSYAKTAVKFKAPKNFDLLKAKLVLHNYESVQEDVLQPYETRVYLYE